MCATRDKTSTGTGAPERVATGGTLVASPWQALRIPGCAAGASKSAEQLVQSPPGTEGPEAMLDLKEARSRSQGFILCLLAAAAIVSVPQPGRATPAYGRQYQTACATCHAPLPPRLNNVGMLFRRAGFRLPDADEDGYLALKSIAARNLADAVSINANAYARWDEEAEEGEARSTLELGEVELVAGTAIGKHLSLQAMFVPHSDEGEVELEDAEIQINTGTPRHQFVARAGLLQPSLWQKANHGTLSFASPLLFDEEPVAPVGEFAGFSLGSNQVALEGGYTFTRLSEGRLLATMLSGAVLNGFSEEGEAAGRNPSGGLDVYLQGLQLFGNRNTVGAYYYRGRTLIDPSGELESPGPFHHRVSRYGLIGNYLVLDRVDLVAGYSQGDDRSEQLGAEVKTRGYFAEVDVSLGKRWLGLYRRDDVDPDRETKDDSLQADTVSLTFQANDHLYLTGDYRRLRVGEEDRDRVAGNLRLLF